MSQTIPRIYALIVAAGTGTRFGSATPKQYHLLAGRPVLEHSIAAFHAVPRIDAVSVVVRSDDAFLSEWKETWLERYNRVSFLPFGADARADTVRAGLRALYKATDSDWVMVHDAARPGITPEMINRVIDAVAFETPGGLLAEPVRDTVKQVHDGKLYTVSREGLYLAQTPQYFNIGVLKEAMKNRYAFTDEAMAVEAAGLVPKIVEGAAGNRKITTPEDLAFMEWVFARRNGQTATDGGAS